MRNLTTLGPWLQEQLYLAAEMEPALLRALSELQAVLDGQTDPLHSSLHWFDQALHLIGKGQGPLTARSCRKMLGSFAAGTAVTSSFFGLRLSVSHLCRWVSAPLLCSSWGPLLAELKSLLHSLPQKSPLPPFEAATRKLNKSSLRRCCSP